MEDDRKKDQQNKLVPMKETGHAHHPTTVDQVKSLFIASGMTAEQISAETHISLDKIQKIVKDNDLPELRKLYIKEGLNKIQGGQISQAQQLLEIEFQFKKMRLIQLQTKLEDFAAYYARHGDFCKRHPVTGELLRDTDGMLMQLPVPSVTREVNQLKESLTLSEGLKTLLERIDDLIHPTRKVPNVNDPDVIDVDMDSLFRKN